MKLIHGIFILTVTLLACNNNTTTTTAPDKESIVKTISAKGDAVVWGIEHSNTDTLVKDFWQSDSTLFLIDGAVIRGYDNIVDVIASLPSRRKANDLDIRNSSVYVLSDDVAVHNLEFDETVTQNNDSITHGKGAWNTVYKKMGDNWKIVLVHESHVKRTTEGNMQKEEK